MNKKAYITPEMEVMNVETVEMIASSLTMFDGSVDTSSDSQLGNRSRGNWDDLWD